MSHLCGRTPFFYINVLFDYQRTKTHSQKKIKWKRIWNTERRYKSWPPRFFFLKKPQHIFFRTEDEIKFFFKSINKTKEWKRNQSIKFECYNRFTCHFDVAEKVLPLTYLYLLINLLYINLGCILANPFSSTKTGSPAFE